MVKKLIIAFLLAISLAFSADHFNQGTIYCSDNVSGTDKSLYEGYSYVTYKWVSPVMATGTDSYHSRPIFIGDCNDNDGRIVAIQYNGTGTEDTNIILHFSSDLANWESTTPDGLDACTITLKADTLGYETGADDPKFHTHNWMIIEADGQTGNPNDTYITVIVTFKKDFIELLPNGDIKYIAKFKTKAVTNP